MIMSLSLLVMPQKVLIFGMHQISSGLYISNSTEVFPLTPIFIGFHQHWIPCWKTQLSYPKSMQSQVVTPLIAGVNREILSM